MQNANIYLHFAFCIGDRLMRRFILFLRGAVPLLLVGLALIGVPALLAWWVTSGLFGWPQLLAGVLGGAALLLILGLIFGRAIGKMRK
ncbi:hypothetical protein EKD04_013650 [Chloroflexales bacterium ZM16-3]|nr:hypothetical protein [Chloroflexales bacterium ZM16-3]